MKIILLTGPSGVGKTTIVNRLCSYCSARGIRVQGFTTGEVREAGQRTGFKITDLASRQEGWLARRDSGVGPRIGSYRVISEDIEGFAVASLEHAATGDCDLVIVDEIGPMEMTSSSFRRMVSKVLNGNQATIATLKSGSRYPEVEGIREKSVQLEITRDNREQIYEKLVEQVDEWIPRRE